MPLCRAKSPAMRRWGRGSWRATRWPGKASDVMGSSARHVNETHCHRHCVIALDRDRFMQHQCLRSRGVVSMPWRRPLTTLSAQSPSGAAEQAEPRIFRTPAGMRYLSLIGTLVVGGVTIFLLGFAILLLFQREWGIGAAIGAMAAFTAALSGYVLGDLRAKWGFRVTLLADRLVLDLPAGRSLIHRPPAQHLTIPYRDIEAVETRLEAYPSLGMGNMQRAYVLSCKDRTTVFLFEDRALATALETSMVTQVAAAIVAHAQVPLRDLGMVEGRGGFLSLWGSHAPDWAAPSLPRSQQLRLWRHAAFTGLLAIGILIAALIIRIVLG